MNWRRSVIGLAIAAPIIALLAFGMTQDPSEIPSPLPGRAAPAFDVKYMDMEGTISLEELRGQVVVLNFWGSWCLQCQIEHRDLSNTAEFYEGKGVQFLGVLYNDSPENARRWIRDMGGQSYPTVLDDHSRVAIDYGLYGAPETFVIDPDGIVVHKQIGPISYGLLRQVIDPLLAEGVSE